MMETTNQVSYEKRFKSMKVPKSEFHILKNRLFEDYIEERRKLKFTKPSHLYSFYVYLAYNHAWKFIDRNKLDDKQIDIIKNLGCYKPSRAELGTRYSPPNHQ